MKGRKPDPGFTFKSTNPARKGQPGMTVARRHGFPLTMPRTSTTWQQHADPTITSKDPLGAARRLRLRRKGK
jgi:hypothetical protein